MSGKELRRRLDRLPTISFALRTPVIRDYLRWQAELHGVDPEELLFETEAVLTTWRLRNGDRLPAFEELLAGEARETGRTVAAVKAELLDEIAAWAGGAQP